MFGMELLDFTDEVLLKVLSYLHHDISDLIHTSQSCMKFDSLLQDKSICEKLKFYWHIYVERLSLIKFLQHPNRATLITQLNFHDMYWMPSSVLRNIVLKTNNLKELYMAGTSLSWVHLLQIFKSNSSHHIQALSYSWNNKFALDAKVPTVSDHNNVEQTTWKVQIQDITIQLERLKFLLLHIPEVFNTNSLVISSYSAASFFISKCTNLEQLFLLSWPKTIQEQKFSVTVPEEHSQLCKANFVKLHTFVISVMEPLRIYLPCLFDCVITSLSENRKNSTYSLKKLWLDHPLMERVHKEQKGERRLWPELDYRNIESLSMPLAFHESFQFPIMTFDKLKTVQITCGSPTYTSLNGMLDKAQNIESICSKSFNYRLDWPKLIAKNPKLSSINVCEDESLRYQEFCLAISTLSNLRQLSIPLYFLLEIKDSGLRAQFADLSESLINEIPETRLEEEISFKKRRIGAPSRNIPSSDPTISGLDILTKSCKDIEEFELGFCVTEERPGRIWVDSLYGVSRWTKLTKLTLDRIPITSGGFLVEITKSCKLESLRLSHLGSRAKCVYVGDLCKALSCCEKLIDFRLEQNFIEPSRNIFKALESCKQLRRVFIFSELNDRPLEEDVLPKLMYSCTSLSVLYVTMGSTPKYLCISIRQNLESLFKRSRPPLSVVVRNTSSGESPHYPSVHYRELVLMKPQVCNATEFATAHSS